MKIEKLKNTLKSLGKSSFRNQEILSIAAEHGINHNDAYKVIRSMHKISRGVYTFEAPTAAPAVSSPVPSTSIANRVEMRGVASISDDEIYVPSVDPTYIKWGEYNTIMSRPLCT